MEEALRFLRTYEFWIYSILAIGGLIYIRKFFLAWEELREAAFGLERESAQSRLNQAASMLIMLLAIGFGVFFLVSFVSPTVSGANPLLTPTLDLLASPTTTLQVEEVTLNGSDTTNSETPQPPAIPNVIEGCTPGQVMITDPENGSLVSGVVTIVGTAQAPNFGFFKYEVQRAGDPIWLTILAVREQKLDEELGPWDTRALPPGDYQLRLVVTDNEGDSLPPCVIQVRVDNPED
jgi:hypothetical protein